MKMQKLVRRINVKFLLLIVLTLSKINPLIGQDRKFVIDFGQYLSAHTPGFLGDTDLTDLEGVDSDIDIAWSPATSDTGLNNFQNSTLGYDRSVYGDYWFKSTSDTTVVIIWDLDMSSTYSIRVYGGINNTAGNHIGHFRIGDDELTLDAKDNQTETIVFDNISPANGMVSMEVWGEDNVYINFIEITEHPLATILSYNIPGALSPAVIDLENRTIDLDISSSLDITSLIAGFELSSGASAQAAGIDQQSGVTANDFTSPVTYTVTGSSGVSQDWVVSVQQKSNQANFVHFSLPGEKSMAQINIQNHTVRVLMDPDLESFDLVSDFSVSNGSTARVNDQIQISGSTSNNFGNSVLYTITAEDGITTQDWVVSLVTNIGVGSMAVDTNVVPVGYKLAVGGQIIAEGVTIQNSYEWPDYVFEEVYALKNLSEIEAFIEDHGHLPDVPSALEIDKKGVDLVKMEILLLQKIEELTLYLIQQQKEIELLKKSIKK